MGGPGPPSTQTQAAPPMIPTRVTLIGGTGFIGTELAMRLAPRFSEVVLPTRRAGRVRDLRVLPNVRIVEADVHDPVALAALVDGADAVVNLVGLLNESGSGRASFAGAHDGLTGKVLEACAAAGVKRYLHVSALNADAADGAMRVPEEQGPGGKISCAPPRPRSGGRSSGPRSCSARRTRSSTASRRCSPPCRSCSRSRCPTPAWRRCGSATCAAS